MPTPDPKANSLRTSLTKEISMGMRGSIAPAFELDTGNNRDVGSPVGVLIVLHVNRRERTHCVAQEPPRAREFHSSLRCPRLQTGRIPIDQVSGAAIDAQPLRRLTEFLGENQVGFLVAKVDAVHEGIRQQEFVAQMGALVKNPQERGESLPSVGERDPDEVIGVLQIFRVGIEVEDREDASLNPNLPLPCGEVGAKY